MEVPDSSTPLSDDDLLSLALGRLVRAHARLEYGLRNIYQVLTDPSSADIAPTGFLAAERLANDCFARLRESELPEELIHAGGRSLGAAREANAMRNSIVHDLWLLDAEGEGETLARWSTFGAVRGQSGTSARSSPRDNDTVDTAREAVERAAVRLSGLFMALHEVLPWTAKSELGGRPTSNLVAYFAMMDDHFIVAENGDCRIINPE